MPLQVPEANRTRQKDFNGIRRTKEGMLYLTHVVRETSSDGFEVSKFHEDGKSDLLPKDGETGYTQERLELFNVQQFTGDGSTKTFTLSSNMDTNTDRLAVFIDNIKKTAYTDFTVNNTTLTFTIAPHSGKIIDVGQINKRYFNNDSDKYQQYTFDNNATYLINSDGELVRRENKSVSRTALGSDNFDTFETGATVNSTTYSV